ncbi:hypothetical protein ACET3X_002281 [Alternaria dauci]|uniref:Alpha/beta hydrolase fold-3 domain-containing protein n=1 Tax=Alternaria dauci TaxID=48095 RepID=A0ABR3URJ0_9PLEO
MTWTPPWTPKEIEEFGKLQKRAEHRERALAKIFGTGTRPYKWDWPDEAPEAQRMVEEARKDALKYQDMAEDQLESLYNWPSKELAKADIFTPGKGVFATFNRKNDWFGEMGFEKCRTHYTFSDNWDKKMMPVTILVPQQMPAGHTAPVMWFFHGGGYCTGASDFPAWYSQTVIKRAKAKEAIIIAPDYPLGPEGNYKDIVNCLRDFLDWYKEDVCFEPEIKKWTEWVYARRPSTKFTIDKDRIYVEGESAGGQAAVTALWLNAAKGGPNLHIDVALLRYPMIAHYKRPWDKCAGPDGTVHYMGIKFTKEQVSEREAKIKRCIEWLEEHGVIPTCSARWPASGMAFAFILSVTEKWQEYFQRQHTFLKAERVESDYMDGIERASASEDSVLHDLLPHIYIFHGWNDSNCPVEDTEEFVRILKTEYPDRYADGNDGTENENLQLDIVKKLGVKQTGSPDGSVTRELDSDKLGHGFDYWLDEKDEKFLRDAYDWVGERWGDSS